MELNTTTTTASVHNLSLRYALEKDKLTYTNVLDWYQNLRIVLKYERKLYVLDGPVPKERPTNAAKNIRDIWKKHFDDSNEISCLMLATMIPDLQKDMESFGAYEILTLLKEMFQQQARQQRFETVTTLKASKMVEGASINVHVLRMKSLIGQLKRLRLNVHTELAKDLILNSLPKSYDQFILNYNKNYWEGSISELHLMLKTVEKNIPSESSQVLIGKGKESTQKAPILKRRKSARNAIYFHCGRVGHWRRHSPAYLAETKKNNNASLTSTSGVERK